MSSRSTKSRTNGGQRGGLVSYQDQWIDEAISEYLALQFADSQKKSDHPLNTW